MRVQAPQAIVIRHIISNDNDADGFTKNMISAVFTCHIPLYVGPNANEYVIVQEQTLSGEAARG